MGTQFCDQTHCRRPSVIMKLLLLATCLAYAKADGHDGMEHGTIVEELVKAGATQLVDFVEAAGLAETLSGPGPFTVVAPTNEAFAKVAFLSLLFLLNFKPFSHGRFPQDTLK